MADNVEISAGEGTSVATDNIGGVNYQRVKVVWGADGTATDADTASGSALPIQVRNSTGTEIATASNPLRTDPTGTTEQPVTNAGTFAVQAEQSGSWAVSATQSGTWNITNISGTISLPTGAATAAKQPALGTAGSASADVITVQGIASMTAVKVDGSAVTQPVSDGGGSLTVDGTVSATQSGTWNVGTVTTLTGITNVVHVDDNSSSLTVDNGGTFAVQASAATSGGVSTSFNSIKATATSVKSSAGQVYGWHIYNPNATAVYVQFFNTASGSVTLGTTTPIYSLGIPATGGATVMIPTGIAHSTAITIAATTTNTGSTAPSSNVDINIFYK